MIPAYPLQWPAGWPRLQSHQRKSAAFTRFKQDLTIADGVSRLLLSLDRISVRREDVVISTNVKTRLDGFPRSDQIAPNDPGVAVYWETRKGNRVMAIDRYTDVADNLAAIAATLDAMRAIDRHGGAQILERAFTGFTALPAPGGSTHWRDVLNVAPDVRDFGRVKEIYRARASSAHPDRGGSHDDMAALNTALQQAESELRP